MNDARFRWREAGGVALAGLSLFTAATEPPVQGWALAPTPVLSIGVVDGDPMYQLAQAISSARLRDGRIAVLNAASSEVRVYDAAGKFALRIGRKGDGPGEFASPWKVLAWKGDSIGVIDRNLSRLQVFDAQGKYVRAATEPQLSSEAVPRGWFRQRTLIEAHTSVADEPGIAAFVSLLPPDPALPGFRQAILSDSLFWVHETGADSWRVFDLDGRPVSTLTFPARFEPQQLTRSYVTGRWRDSLDVEYIRVYRFTGSTPSPHSTPRRPPPPVVRDSNPQLLALRGRLRSTLRGLITMEERTWADSGAYTKGAAALLRPPPEIRLLVLNASKRGWTAVAIDSTNAITCGTWINEWFDSATSPPWPEAVPGC